MLSGHPLQSFLPPPSVNINNMHRLPLLLCGLLVVCVGCLGQDYLEEDRPNNVRARPPRGPVVASRPAKQAVQKTSTTEAPPAEAELEYEDELAEEEPAATTTTEPPRKGIRGGVVRPFRSNTELLETLKRRRAQVQNGGGNGGGSQSSAASTSTTTQEPAASSGGRSGRNKPKSKFSRGGGSSGVTSSTTEVPEEEQAPQRSRIFGGRGRRF